MKSIIKTKFLPTIAMVLALVIGLYSGHSKAQQGCRVTITPTSEQTCIYPTPPERSSQSDPATTVRACRGNEVCYVAHCTGAVTYSWTTVGGSIVSMTPAQTNETCCVLWGNEDEGFLTVTATLQDGTSCTKTLRVELEDKPTAVSVSIPPYMVDPADPDEKTLDVCVGDSLTFVDRSESNAAAITNYYWEYPGGYSTGSTASFTVSATGSYRVIHRVYTECGCYDEEIIKLNVESACPLEVTCYGTVCAGTTQSYKVTDPDCSKYYWYVEGGIIQDGQNTNTVTVYWQNPESGYGTLYLDGASCNCQCKSRKALRIPVISDGVSIDGSDVMCLGEYGTYSLPLWGSTEYQWTVSPSTGLVIHADNNRVLVDALSPGTYTLTARYICGLLGCGYFTVTKTLTVKDTLAITNPCEVTCQGATQTYQTNASTASQWQVLKDGTLLYQSTDVSLSYIFNDLGLYTVRATNSGYCGTATAFVRVKPVPSVPTGIQGPQHVCKSSSARYSANSPGADCYLEWEWNENGVFTKTYTGENVTITFGDTVLPIRVRTVDRETNCSSEWIPYLVSKLTLDAWPYNDPVLMCEGESMTLDQVTDQSADGVLYKWSTTSTQGISVWGADNHPDVSIHTYVYDPGHLHTATVKLSRYYCGIKDSNLVNVTIGKVEPPTIIPPTNPICTNIPVQFTVDAHHLEYASSENSYWTTDWDATHRNGIPVNLVFPDLNTHTITLHYVTRYGCDTTASIQCSAMYSFPNVSIQQNGTQLCVSLSGLDYLWSTDETTQCITASASGDYYCTVSDPDGHCSRRLSFHYDAPCNAATGTFGFTSPLCYNLVQLNTNGITHSVSFPVTVTFQSSTLNQTIEVYSSSQTVAIPFAGTGTATLKWTSGDTCYTCSGTYSAGNDILNFQASSDCNGNIVVGDLSTGPSFPNINHPMRHVTVIDENSTTVASLSWPHGTNDLYIPNLPEGDYRIRIRVGSDPNCVFTTSHYHQLPPTILVQPGLTLEVCDNTPVLFSAFADGSDLTYLWDFPDQTQDYGNTVYHTFHDNNTREYVLLTVTDKRGCTDSYTFSVNVNEDPFSTLILHTTKPSCPETSATLSWFPTYLSNDATYTWYHDPQNSAATSTALYTGNYRATISNPHRCVRESSVNVKVPNRPAPSILCEDQYCPGDRVRAIGNTGGTPPFTYHWSVTNPINSAVSVSPSASSPNITFYAAIGGSYTLTLTVTDNSNCTTTVSKTITVSPTPTAPLLNFGSNSCITQGPVDLQADSYSLWSNGTSGTSTQFYTDGEAQAFYYDPVTGCRSEKATISIPVAPDFDGMLTGCYAYCLSQLPLSLPVYSLGMPPGIQWKWTRNNILYSSGTTPIFPPLLLPLPSFASYRLEIPDYGEQCLASSPTLTLIQASNCGTSQLLQATVLKKTCTVDECKISFSVTVSVHNTNALPTSVTSVTCSPAAGINVSSPALPLSMNGWANQDFVINITPYSMTPGVFTIYLLDGSTQMGSFTIDLSDWMDCIAPVSCDCVERSSISLDGSPVLGQSLYYNFSLDLSSTVNDVLALWCEPGQLLYSNISLPSCTGLIMLDHGRLTQMLQSGEEVCLYVLCCEKDKLCLTQVCFTAEELLELLPSSKSMDIHSIQMDNGSSHLLLKPNPSTGKVTVLDASTGKASEKVVSVELFSPLGQCVLRTRRSNSFDVSALPAAAYIVKIATGDGITEYHKLIRP